MQDLGRTLDFLLWWWYRCVRLWWIVIGCWAEQRWPVQGLWDRSSKMSGPSTINHFYYSVISCHQSIQLLREIPCLIPCLSARSWAILSAGYYSLNSDAPSPFLCCLGLRLVLWIAREWAKHVHSVYKPHSLQWSLISRRYLMLYT